MQLEVKKNVYNALRAGARPARRVVALSTRWKTLLLVRWRSHPRLTQLTLCAAVVLLCGLLLYTFWTRLDADLASSQEAVIPKVAIGIGVAITGIIAIAFSLSLFAIQQVADRGTPATLQAYARDQAQAVTYWALAILAATCFAMALLKTGAEYRTATVVVGLLSLVISFILLFLHFKRVVRFADPRYMVSRLRKQGENQLKELSRLRRSIAPGRRAESER